MKKTLAGIVAANLVAAASAGTTIVVSVGESRFVAEIEDSDTGKAFIEKLPLTLNMSELNGNEKYCYGVSLPTKSVYCSTIAAGDLMLYGSNCVVLFYGSAGGYSYTRIGKFESTEGLAAALGSGAAKVTFAKAEVKANIEMKGGKPVVSAETNMPSATSFTVLGATELVNPEWTEVAETESSDYRFFKVATK